MKTTQHKLQGLQGYKTGVVINNFSLQKIKNKLQGSYKRLLCFFQKIQVFKNQIIYHLVTCNQKSKKIYFTKNMILEIHKIRNQ